MEIERQRQDLVPHTLLHDEFCLQSQSDACWLKLVAFSFFLDKILIAVGCGSFTRKLLLNIVVLSQKLFVWHDYKQVHLFCTLLQKPSVTQEHNMRVTENSVIHVHRTEKSVIHIDWAARPTVHGWWNIPAPTCCAPASRLVLLTVHL
jgi:hypothetical protein